MRARENLGIPGVVVWVGVSRQLSSLRIPIEDVAVRCGHRRYQDVFYRNFPFGFVKIPADMPGDLSA